MRLLKRIPVLLCTIPVIALTACEAAGMQAAYDIRDKYDGHIKKPLISEDETKTPDKNTNTPFHEKPTFKIDLSEAEIIDADKTMIYGKYALQVLDLKRGDTIYDVANVMEPEEADRFISEVRARGKNTILENGKFITMESAEQYKLYFLKVRITNRSDHEDTLFIKTIFYGRQNGEDIKVSGTVYDFSGEHYRVTERGNGDEYLKFGPGESLETVMMLGMPWAQRYDNYYGPGASEYATLYLSSPSLDGYVQGAGNKLPAGSVLMKLMENGEILVND